MSEKRIKLGKTAMAVLRMLDREGVVPLSHGVRYAEINPYQIRVMSSTNWLLRSSGMVEWAGGNYGRWSVRLTDYGRECLTKGSRLPSRRVPGHTTYGPTP